MSEYTHTPGPWMIFNGGDIGSAAVRRPETIVIKAGTVKGETIGEAMKNARLIAAAPELLEACQMALDWFNRNTKLGHTPGPVEQALIDAISKATEAK